MRLIVSDPSGNFLVGFAKNKLKACIGMRKDLREPVVERVYKVNDFTVTVHAEEGNDFIRIEGGVFKGFLCHPRTFEGKGWNPKGEELPNGPFNYPLIDDDHGTRGLTKGAGWRVVNSPPENYGNLDWIGEKKQVVSWRGPAGRQLPMDRLLAFPGFTEWDGSSLTQEFYTPYRNLVYRGGKVVHEFLYGYKVLGAAMRKGKIVAVVGVDYSGIANPDGGNGGFFDEVWWGEERIGWQHGSRPSTAWFFNADGNEAVSGNQKLSITDDGVCSFSDLGAGSGTQTNMYDGSNRSVWGVLKSGSWPIFRDYAGLSQQWVTLNVISHESSTLTGNSSENREELPIMMSGVEEPTVTISGPEDYAGEGAYTAVVSGDKCGIDTVQWSYPTGCGMGTVSVTVTFLGGKTATSSMDVRMPTGYWLYVGGFGTIAGGTNNPVNNQCIPPGSWPPNSMTNPPNQCISGGTRYDVLWRGCTLEAVGCQENFSGITTGCDLGSAVSVPCWPAPAIITGSCCDYNNKYRTYWWVCYYDKYEWVCP